MIISCIFKFPRQILRNFIKIENILNGLISVVALMLFFFICRGGEFLKEITTSMLLKILNKPKHENQILRRQNLSSVLQNDTNHVINQNRRHGSFLSLPLYQVLPKNEYSNTVSKGLSIEYSIDDLPAYEQIISGSKI
jgi:hypothetical protein